MTTSADGSKGDGGRVGCGFYAPPGYTTKTFRITDGVSVFTAEVVAVIESLGQGHRVQHSAANINLFKSHKVRF